MAASPPSPRFLLVLNPPLAEFRFAYGAAVDDDSFVYLISTKAINLATASPVLGDFTAFDGILPFNPLAVQPLTPGQGVLLQFDGSLWPPIDDLRIIYTPGTSVLNDYITGDPIPAFDDIAVMQPA